MADRKISPLPQDDDDDPARRTDAAGYDVTPPPAIGRRTSGNPGLHDEPPIERDGWREFDTDRAWGDTWVADTGDGTAALDAEDVDEDEELDEPARRSDGGTGDVLEEVMRVLDEDADLDATDISVEHLGDEIILRGSAATDADRARAESLARSVAGVGRVENLIGLAARD